MVTAGSRLGSYEILAPIGAGGMGEVWKARDTKLGREVAIKVLPSELADNPEALSRFRREAQALASLNHPNIATIYGVEESGGVRALVMELVEGEGLDARIARGAMQVEEALPIALQIAEGLEAAHERGIVHRDLKPGNVKVRPDGTVKVLDFGLAKAWEEPGASSSDLALSPTITGHHTRAGVILGTAAYMSPEQARGKAVDKRADIWAFGCLLYEMLTGKRLFAGETTSDTLAAVLRQEVDLAELPAELPTPIRPLLARCLERDPKRRLRDIGEARVAIEEGLSGATRPRVPPSGEIAAAHEAHLGSAVGSGAAPARHFREAALWVALALAASAVLALWLRSSAPRLQSASMVRASITTPEGLVFANRGLDPHGPAAISPDGRLLVFPASSKDRGIQLWIRPLDAAEARPLPGTEQASYPFWSPDSRSIGFFAGGKLKKVSVNGGEPLDICDASSGRGGSWSRDGTIVFPPSLTSALYRVSASGGTPEPVTRFDASKGQGTHRFPCFLPDGRHFIYYASEQSPLEMEFPGPWDGIYLGSLDGGADRFLVRSESEGQVASSHLLFMRRNELLAVPFDPRSFAVSGEPSVLAENVERDMGRSKGGFTLSEEGTLVYHPGARANTTQLTWLDRAGRPVGSVGEPGVLGEPELSPDGRRAVVSVLDAASRTVQVWLYDLGSGAGSRFTLGSSASRFAVWSADGSRIYFSSNRKGSDDLYVKPASGAGDEEQIFHSEAWLWPSAYSGDGPFLVFTQFGAKVERAVCILPLAGERKATVLALGNVKEPVARVSPDSRWIAYESEESGRGEIHVAAFPGPGGRWQVSTGGGGYVRWRRDGRELYYVSSDDEMMAVEVRAGTSFEFGTPRMLFKLPPVPNTNYWYYDVAPDGNRFLITYPVGTQNEPLALVLNWPGALKR
ncbi:MAG: serine/threonine-protein kinase [Acidobacteriia bacterium]|nr:serine/threonine-protein kinase [Terriglobia bacterium]